jgi:DNA-binding MarR family transcriptional regulator
MVRVKTMADQDMERTDPRRGFDFDEVLDNQMVETSRTSSSARRRRSSNGAEDTVSGEVVNSTSARNPGNDQLNNRIFFRLFQLGNELQRQAMQQLGITTVQWAALGALSQDKFASGIPFGQLGDYLVVTRQNLDGVIKRLERDGLVQRVTGDGDKRARLVQLTPSGRTYWKETLQRIFQFYDQATAHFSFDDRVALVHYLNALQKDLAGVELPKSGLPKRNRS